MILSIMVFECEHCGYTTNFKSNFKKHINRINPCYRREKHNIKMTANNTKMTANNTKMTANNTNDERLACSKCLKVFTRMVYKRKHEEICTGVDSLTCPICYMRFEYQVAKYRHIKSKCCIPPYQTINNNTIVNNNIINNHVTTNTTQNININVFGKEDLSHLLKDNDLIYRINKYSKDGVYGLVKMIDDIYLNKETPENHTIIKPCERGEGLYIRDSDNEWVYREYEDVKQDIVSSLDKYIDMYHIVKKEYDIKLTEKKERRRIKELVTLLLTIGGMMNDELCRELQIDEEDIDEEIKVNKKFDKATLDRLHQKTNVYWKKLDGKIRRVEFKK